MREASAIEAALALASARNDGGRDGMDEVEAAGADVAVEAGFAVVLVSAEEAAVTGADAGFAVDCSGADTEDTEVTVDAESNVNQPTPPTTITAAAVRINGLAAAMRGNPRGQK